jgi:alpha-1,6-mannosyltransferase
VGTDRTRRLLAPAGLAVLAASSLAIVAGAQNDPNTLVPAAKLRYPDWLHGPLAWLELDLSTAGLAWLLLAMCAGYALVLAGRLPARAAVAAIVALHLLYMLAPPLLSSDVFGYVDSARLGTLHGIDPYSPASTPLPDDDVLLYRRWGTDLPSPYGPLFVLLSYAFVPLGIGGAMWAFKVLLALASLGVVWLVWRCAAARGRDPVAAALFVGLNPLLLVYAVGGAHNDFLGVAAVMASVLALTAGRTGRGGAALVAASAVKLPLGLPLLYALARPRQDPRRLIAGAAAALAAVVAVSLAAFGTGIHRFLDAVRDQQDDVAIYSVPNQLGELLGFGGITGGIRLVAAAGLLAAIALTLRAARRGGDWVTAAGWATFALIVSSAWLLPWYAVWLLPLAAVGSRRLRVAALALTAYVVLTRVELWL